MNDRSAPLPTSNRARVTAAALALVLGLAVLSSCSSSDQGQTAADAAHAQVGKPYVYGGNSPSTGFDCSGLTSWSWKQAEVTIPRTATAQYQATTRLTRSQLQPGDLIFYGSSVNNIQHVAIYYGNNMAVSASNPSTGVEMINVDQWWLSARVAYGRVSTD